MTIVVAGDGAFQAYLLLPAGSGFQYTTVVLDNAGGTVGAIGVADVNGDGFTELFVPNYDKNYVNVYTYGHP
jgi:hypothetical protein